MKKYTVTLIFLFIYFNLNANSILDNFKSIPFDDQENIKYLFHNIFLQQDGAYTIFGDKPVSSAGSFVIASWEATIMEPAQVGKFGRSWKTWQNYKDRFPLQKYIIVGERFPFKKSGLVVIYTFVINKKSFIETLNNHLILFESVLNKKIDAENFLDNIETGKCSFLTSINRNEMLLGILLGYGEHNASLFYKRSKRSHARKLFPLDEVKLECTDKESYPMMLINPVQYSADLDHPETKALQKKYKNLRKKISEIYSQGDFLEITLTQLSSD
jgi:hypothetical protein